MARKLYDLTIKTSTYTTRSGEQKGRWQTIGAMMEGNDGNKFLLIDPWFNLSGFPHEEGKAILVSLFEPREEEKPKSRGRQPGDDFADDIPWRK